MILVIFLLGFGVPALRLQGLPNDAVFWGTTALVLSYGAYVAEVFRSGISYGAGCNRARTSRYAGSGARRSGMSWRSHCSSAGGGSPTGNSRSCG